jgi:hypothetical protein
LEADYKWEQPTPADQEWSELSHRTLWYSINAFIIRKDDAQPFYLWALQQEFWGRWMPDVGEFSDVFMGELYWSPTYAERFAEERGEHAWTYGSYPDRVPYAVIMPGMTYNGVGTSRDCSSEEGSDHCPRAVALAWRSARLALDG